MGTRTEHAPGTFSWVDLTTPDAEGAQAFYGGLFGWEFEHNEIPGGGTYTMCLVGGEHVAAIPGSNDAHPPGWNNYVTVASADDAATKAAELGAEVVQQPFDVMEAGRMAVLRDPAGAGLCVWEARDQTGAGRVNDPGCLTWNELHTPDHSGALEFYTGLFGWNTESVDTDGGPDYTMVKVGERRNGGVMDAQPGEPPNWLPYFTVEDRDAAVERAQGLGGTSVFSIDMPAGRIAVLTDPQGATVGIFAGEVDD